MRSVPKKRSYPKKVKREVSSRKVSIQYFVKVNGIDRKICKQEFLSVHGLQHSKKRVQLLYQQMAEGTSTPKTDKRGKHANRANKVSNEAYENVKKHISSIPKYTSHYSRKKNPGKVYIDHDLSISALYNDYYVEWCRERNSEPVKESYYRRIFCTEFNIGFKLPKSDTCKTCDMLHIKIENAKHNNEQTNSLQIELELHQRRAQALQDSLKNETENAKANASACVISFDLQQALPVPNLTVGPAFYLRKLWTYNLGIHDCVTDKAYMYMWPENVAKRGSDEIASIIYKHFKENPPNAEKLIVFSDNCSGQNKNWSLICLWQQLIKEKFFKFIEHRFLIVGHTRLPSDRDFALIEKYKRRYISQVYVPDDWYKAVEKSRRQDPFNVTVIKRSDILTFKDLQNNIVKKTLTDCKSKLMFSKICSFKFSYENTNIMYIKHAFNEDYKSVNIGKRGRSNTEIFVKDLRQKYSDAVALDPKKLNNLSQLVSYIPLIYLKFYEEIGVCTQRTEGHPKDKEPIIENQIENLDEDSDYTYNSDED